MLVVSCGALPTFQASDDDRVTSRVRLMISEISDLSDSKPWHSILGIALCSIPRWRILQSVCGLEPGCHLLPSLLRTVSGCVNQCATASCDWEGMNMHELILVYISYVLFSFLR